MSIAVDKPFEVGDSITVGDFSGTVEHVGLKTTRVRARGGEQIIIANAELLRNTVYNDGRTSTRRIQFNLRASPSTPRELAARVPDMLREIIGKHEKARFDRAHLKTVDQNWIEYEIVYTMLDTDYKLYVDTQQAINLDAMQMFADLGISTAPRPQHVLLQEAPGLETADRRDLRAAEKPAANEDAPDAASGRPRYLKH